MPNARRYASERITIRQMLRDLGHKPSLREKPQPSVFLDTEHAARFFADTWPEVHKKVILYFQQNYQQS